MLYCNHYRVGGSHNDSLLLDNSYKLTVKIFEMEHQEKCKKTRQLRVLGVREASAHS